MIASKKNYGQPLMKRKATINLKQISFGGSEERVAFAQLKLEQKTVRNTKTPKRVPACATITQTVQTKKYFVIRKNEKKKICVRFFIYILFDF